MANWHYIPGYPDYKISDEGQVFSKKSNKVLKECLRNNYPGVTLLNETGRKDHPIHRLVAKAFLIGEPNQTQVNHKDGNRKNNQVENLEWCTPSENIQHAHDTGLLKGRKGTKHHNSKLTESDVKVIKQRLKSGDRVCHIAKDYGIYHGAISAINRGRAWTHVQ